ncbi:hypothetical protein CsatB_006192 [Cannabis sativa]
MKQLDQIKLLSLFVSLFYRFCDLCNMVNSNQNTNLFCSLHRLINTRNVFIFL